MCRIVRMKPIQIAIQHMGNASRLAKALGVTTQAICFWRDDERKIPADRCIQIEAATGSLVRCEDLRPDVRWDVLRQPEQASPAVTQVQPAISA